MIEPGNIDAISYDYKNGIMEIVLKESIVFEGFNRNSVKMRCDHDKFKHYLNKWLSFSNN